MNKSINAIGMLEMAYAAVLVFYPEPFTPIQRVLIAVVLVLWLIKESDHNVSKDVFWVRLFGRGFSIKRTPMLFSERAGHTKTYRLICGWRVVFLGQRRRTGINPTHSTGKAIS
jgi:hypothetical protein